MNTVSSENNEAWRSQRMTEDETRAVIHLWQQECVEQGGLTDTPAVSDVAEGLGVSAEDVQRLLTHVRAVSEAEQQRLAAAHREAEREQERQAEQSRQQSEWQRQQAESHRQQSEWQRQQAQDFRVNMDPYAMQQQSFYRTQNRWPGAVPIVVIILIVVFMSLIISALHNDQSGPQPPGPICTIDNKTVPCSDIPIPMQSN